MKSLRKVVYIIGATRSGSTVLDLIISSNSKCATVGELRLFGKHQCGMCEKSCSYWDSYRKLVGRYGIYGAAFEVFNKDILVDSSKRWHWIFERVGKEDYNYKIIHLVRNGLDRLKTQKIQKGLIRKSDVKGWVKTYERSEEIRKQHDGLFVRYEDIHREEEIRRICGFVGIEFEPTMLEFWKFQHHGIAGSPTAYSFVKSYHGIGGGIDFYRRHGFNIRPRLGHDFLSKKDVKVFKKYGGEKLNRKLGYE